MSNMEYLVEPETAVSSYNESRNYLYFVMGLNLIFEISMTYYIYMNEM